MQLLAGVVIMSNKLLITKKLRGDDGYRVFSVRLKTDTLERINELADSTGRTRNELIGLLLDFALEHSEVVGES
jgi:hypothetical protein